MEAIAALALACNVVQVVELGLKTAAKCGEIYNKGSTAEHQDLEYTSKQLAEITRNLSASIQNAGTNKPLTNDDHELQSLAQRCTKTANNLLEELHILKSPGRQGKRAALLKTWLSVRRSNEIKRLNDKLREDETVLNTRLLLRLSERVDLLAVQQDDSFKTLNQIVQNFVNRLAIGYNQLSDLISQENTTTRSTVMQEHRDTRKHITSNFQDMQLKHEDSVIAQHCARFLASLHYPEMNQRQETISDAHQQTFTWIFDRTGKGIRPWDDFVTWLEKGDGIYWIQGKAGAGKSTLMNYISADPRTTDSLNVWARPSQALILTFFFWNAGTKLQKTSLGLLRSLLYQILDHRQGIIPELIKSQCKAAVDGPIPTWTRKRVESTLKFVIDKISFPLCLFVDGLDEFDEGEEDLLQLISAFQDRPSVKICASSRPSPCFINAFKHSAQLKLQDLTMRDIEIYVTDRLHRNREMASMLQRDSRRGSRLINDVIAKSAGVFLWVELAVKILLKGLTNKDDWDMMEKRVDLLPQSIESLYIHMWNRLGEDKRLYRESAALYFRIILTQQISVLQFAIATNENLQATLLDLKSPPPATEDFISMCQDAIFCIQTRCAGLLEVDDFKYATDDEAEGDNRLKQLHDWTTVRFIHRTARDFLLETKDGQAILGDNPPLASSPHILLCKSLLGVISLLSTYSMWLHRVLDVVKNAQTAESGTLDPLMNIIESYFGAKYSTSLKDSNWYQKYLSTVSTDTNFRDTYMWDSKAERMHSPDKDVLGMAAATGIYLDLWKRFPGHIKRAGLDYTRYLLVCALDAPRAFRSELVLILLSNGAHPNETFVRYDGSPVSYWNRVLRNMWFRRCYAPKITHANIIAFLNSGADLHEKIQIGYVLRDLPSTSLAVKMKRHLNLECELSARYIITELLRHDSRLSEMEERFENVGAQSTRRLVSAHYSSDHDLYLKEQFSKQDFQRISEALDQVLTAAHTGFTHHLPHGFWQIQVSITLEGTLDGMEKEEQNKFGTETD